LWEQPSAVLAQTQFICAKRGRAEAALERHARAGGRAGSFMMDDAFVASIAHDGLALVEGIADDEL